jgi:hypothetical protein
MVEEINDKQVTSARLPPDYAGLGEVAIRDHSRTLQDDLCRLVVHRYQAKRLEIHRLLNVNS